MSRVPTESCLDPSTSWCSVPETQELKTLHRLRYNWCHNQPMNACSDFFWQGCSVEGQDIGPRWEHLPIPAYRCLRHAMTPCVASSVAISSFVKFSRSLHTTNPFVVFRVVIGTTSTSVSSIFCCLSDHEPC